MNQYLMFFRLQTKTHHTNRIARAFYIYSIALYNKKRLLRYVQYDFQSKGEEPARVLYDNDNDN